MPETLGEQILRLNKECFWSMYPKDCHREAVNVLYLLAGQLPDEVLNQPALPVDRKEWAASMRAHCGIE